MGSKEQRTELAEDRTDLAEDRTILANERTFAGWARTALASLGLGLGFQALFRQVEPTWVAKSVATVFILMGVWIIWTAERRAGNLLRDHNENEVRVASLRSYRVLAIAITIGGAGLLVSLWVLL